MQVKACRPYHEFACYAEAAMAAEEYRAWAGASSVEAYLASQPGIADFPVASNTKLAVNWSRP